jgi:hypothetical protein
MNHTIKQSILILIRDGEEGIPTGGTRKETPWRIRNLTPKLGKRRGSP